MIQKIHQLGHHQRQTFHQLTHADKNSRYQSLSFYNRDLGENSRLQGYIFTQPNSRQKTLFLPQTQQQERKFVPNNRNQQIVIINDRKFVKNRTPEKYVNLLLHPKQKNTIKREQLDPWVKIGVLQNRISQLHRQNQTQLIRLMKVNKQMEIQLENEKKKSKHFNKNKNISGEIETLIKLIISQKQIQGQNLIKQQKRPSLHSLHSLQNEITFLSNQNTQFRQRTNWLEKQLRMLKIENKRKMDEKQKEMQSLMENKMEVERKLSIVTKQKQQINLKLHEIQKQCKSLEQKIKLIQKDNKTRDEKLKNISLQESYLTNQQINDMLFLNINSSVRNKQNHVLDEQLTEDSLCNIIQKMELLTNTNDKIIIENQMLHNEINKLLQNNQTLKNNLSLAYEQMHRKQLILDAKIQQNNNLKRSISLSNFNQNPSKSKEDEKDFQLQLSNTTINIDRSGKKCERCKQLVKSLFRLKKQVMADENFQHTLNSY